MKSGIYKIENLINHKIYIGQSKNIELRWKHHLWEAQNDKQVQYNYSIHKAFRKYGIDNFSFDIIELCEPDKLNEKEQYYISFYDSYNKGYNETKGGESGPALIGENNPKAKLTRQDVINIRAALMKYKTRQEVYELYKDKISLSAFSKIWQGVTWTDVMPEAIEFRKSPEYELYIKEMRRKAPQGKNKKFREDILKRKASGEQRLEVYNLYYKNIYSIGGFNKIWYQKV